MAKSPGGQESILIAVLGDDTSSVQMHPGNGPQLNQSVDIGEMGRFYRNRNGSEDMVNLSQYSISNAKAVNALDNQLGSKNDMVGKPLKGMRNGQGIGTQSMLTLPSVQGTTNVGSMKTL